MQGLFKYLGYFIKVTFNFLWLTLFTQVGGIIYLLFKPLSTFILFKNPELTKRQQRGIRFGGFFLFYLVISLVIVPPIAKIWDKTPLPWFATKNTPLAPRSLIFPLLNRHYVKHDLKQLVIEKSIELSGNYSGSKLLYLDGAFPFFDVYVMFPHLSHYDGKKLDLCFLYQKKKTGKITNTTPWFWGYGACEVPKDNEKDMAAKCDFREYWQYSILYYFTPQWFQSWYNFDEERNQFLLKSLAKDDRIDKIFIEPHLSKRLKVKRFAKIKFHGCKSVRHDDHIHIQI